MEYILLAISAIFVNNVVLSQFLGICPFLGVSKKMSTAAGMGAAVTFVLTLATIVTYLLQKYVLNTFHIEYMQTILFILVIAALVQMVEIILKKMSPSAYFCHSLRQTAASLALPSLSATAWRTAAMTWSRAWSTPSLRLLAMRWP